MRVNVQQKEHLVWIRKLSLAERSEMVLSACRTASLIEQSRLAGGLAPARRAPWPVSVLALLKRHASNAQ